MLLKDIFNPEFYDGFSAVLNDTLPVFDAEQFKRRIYVPHFAELELKQRMQHTARVLAGFLENDFDRAAGQLRLIVENLQAAGIEEQVIEYMFLPEYIEQNGIDDCAAALDTIEFVTRFTSCELAIRPFIVKYGQPVLDRMLDWSSHPHPMVRRLSSEGSRPRLPWAIALPELKRDPAPILPILENLKNDESESVRRSVANNLNDISKDNPRVTLDLARQWLGQNSHLDAVVKHGCRTLLKQGLTEVLELFGYHSESLLLDNFVIQTPVVSMGDQLRFDFEISNGSERPVKLRLEYAIYLLKQNGNHSKKVFKISERELAPNEFLAMAKAHRFKPISTRRYYSGQHRLAVIVNGFESESMAFDLVV